MSLSCCQSPLSVVVWEAAELRSCVCVWATAGNSASGIDCATVILSRAASQKSFRLHGCVFPSMLVGFLKHRANSNTNLNPSISNPRKLTSHSLVLGVKLWPLHRRWGNLPPLAPSNSTDHSQACCTHKSWPGRELALPAYCQGVMCSHISPLCTTHTVLKGPQRRLKTTPPVTHICLHDRHHPYSVCVLVPLGECIPGRAGEQRKKVEGVDGGLSSCRSSWSSHGTTQGTMPALCCLQSASSAWRFLPLWHCWAVILCFREKLLFEILEAAARCFCAEEAGARGWIQWPCLEVGAHNRSLGQWLEHHPTTAQSVIPAATFEAHGARVYSGMNLGINKKYLSWLVPQYVCN